MVAWGDPLCGGDTWAVREQSLAKSQGMPLVADLSSGCWDDYLDPNVGERYLLIVMLSKGSQGHSVPGHSGFFSSMGPPFEGRSCCHQDLHT